MVGALLEDEVRKTCSESSISDKNRQKLGSVQRRICVVGSALELALCYTVFSIWRGCAARIKARVMLRLPW